MFPIMSQMSPLWWNWCKTSSKITLFDQNLSYSSAFSNVPLVLTNRMNGRHFESVPHCEKSSLCNSQSEAGYSSSIFFLEMLCVVVSGPHNRMILSKHQHFFLHKWGRDINLTHPQPFNTPLLPVLNSVKCWVLTVGQC